MLPTTFDHDPTNHRITVTRRYLATRSRVWRAWTDADILDLWWGPKPWYTVTKSFDFSAGGHWLYCMTGPAGEEHWCKVTYRTIDPEDAFTARDSFCDANGHINTALPSNNWATRFIDHTAHTDVIVTIDFDSPEDMQTIVEMGFEQGFTAGLNQLQEMLEQPRPGSKRITWKVQIAADRSKVWALTFDKESFRQWTAAFSEGSCYEGVWGAGNIIHFLAPGQDGAEPSGMVSVVRDFRPPEFCSIEHLGIVENGKDDTASEAAMAWAPAFENYTLNECAGGTEFIVEMDVNEEYLPMFEDSWPKALAILKRLCEK